MAAALAAGETPSPELVAQAGAEGTLKPAHAWALLDGGEVYVPEFGTNDMDGNWIIEGIGPDGDGPPALDRVAEQDDQPYVGQVAGDPLRRERMRQVIGRGLERQRRRPDAPFDAPRGKMEGTLTDPRVMAALLFIIMGILYLLLH